MTTRWRQRTVAWYPAVGKYLGLGMGVETVVVHTMARDSNCHQRLAVLIDTEGWGCWASRLDRRDSAGDGDVVAGGEQHCRRR